MHPPCHVQCAHIVGTVALTRIPGARRRVPFLVMRNEPFGRLSAPGTFGRCANLWLNAQQTQRVSRMVGSFFVFVEPPQAT